MAASAGERTSRRALRADQRRTRSATGVISDLSVLRTPDAAGVASRHRRLPVVFRASQRLAALSTRSPPPRLNHLTYHPCPPCLPCPPGPPCLCSEWFVAIDQPEFDRYVAWRGRQTLLHIKEAPSQAASD